MPTELINTRYEIIETEPPSATSPFVVSKARDNVEGRIVALQVLQADRLRQIRREALVLAVSEAMRLEHPNITRVYDQGVSAETSDYFVASEYVRGITLQERIRRVAPFSLPVTCDIAVAIAEALDAAHRAGVVHGDLQPQDVLLSPEGQIKVANFAYGRVASAVDPAGPEPSIAGDISAVGALLYEMLTGTVPPPAAAGVLPSPRSVNTGVPPALEGVVQKAMHPDPAVRYRTATTLLLDLQAVREGHRTGRSLAWSPLSEKRAPRPPSPAETTIIAPRPADVDAIRAAEPAAAAPTSRGRNAPALAAAADELEEERAPYPVRERTNPLGPILGIVFTLLVVGVIGFCYYLSKFLTIPNDVQVPMLIGKTYDDAKQLAAQDHFNLVEGTSDYSTKWPENQIYEQDPPAGRTIKAGRDVTVSRSLGPRLLKVPRLSGETKDRALHDLSDTGLPEGTVTEEFSDSIQPGIVIGQSPDADSMVARNTAINLRLSKGKQPPDPPDNVSGDAPSYDTITLQWDKAPRADSYTVYRLANGNSATVAKGIVDTHIVDNHLQPDTAYSYTVTATNAAGPSSPSEPALVTTPAKPVPPPVLPRNTQVKPAPPAPPPAVPDVPSPSLGNATVTNAPPTRPATPAKMRQFTIDFRVPRHPSKARHVQFEVQDVTGTNLVYDEMHPAGDEISAPIQAFGNKITFRIFLDGSLVKQQTL